MAFPFNRSIGSELNKTRDRERSQITAHNVGLSSVRKGEGSIDVLDEDGDVDTPLEVFGTLADGTTGWGTKISGVMVNMRAWTTGKVQSVENTLASHDTRITTAQNRADKGVADAATAQARANKGVADAAAAQSTANGAVSVNNTQNSRLTALENQGHVDPTAYQMTIQALINRIVRLENAVDSAHPGLRA